MIAWKFLAPGAVAPFTGVRWPVPEGGSPGAWLAGLPGPGKGVHACAVEDLPYWVAEELWEVELDDPVTRAPQQLIAPRGRLLARVQTWPAAQDGFTGACIERTRARLVAALAASGYAADAERLASEPGLDAQRDVAAAVAKSGPPVAGYLFDVIRRRPFPGLCAYIAANAAAAIGGMPAHDAERAAQVEWLASNLHL